MWIPDEVANCQSLTSSEKLLFPALAKRAGPEGIIQVDNATLGDWLGIPERTASAFVTQLHRAGLVRVEVDRREKAGQQRRIIIEKLTQDFASGTEKGKGLLEKFTQDFASATGDPDSQYEIMLKFTQNLASTLPDAEFCVNLAQIFASTIKSKLADNKGVKKEFRPDAKSCVNSEPLPCLENADIEYNNINILNNTLLERTHVHTPTHESAPIEPVVINPRLASLGAGVGKVAIDPFITIGGNYRLGPEEIGPDLKIQGYPHKAIIPFVAEHNGADFADRATLINQVRQWLQVQKKKSSPKPDPALSLQARKDAFRADVAAWVDQNPDKYETAMIDDFIAYWTEDDGKRIRRDDPKNKFFDMGKRLAYSYRTIWLPRQPSNYNGKSTTRYPTPGIKSTGYIDLDAIATRKSEQAADDAGQSDAVGSRWETLD